MTVTVTIQGPSKSGKTQLANLIHNALISAPNQRYEVSIGDECECEVSNRQARCVNNSSHVCDVNVIVGQTDDEASDVVDEVEDSEDATNDTQTETDEVDVVEDVVSEEVTEEVVVDVVEDGNDAETDDLDDEPTDEVADTEAVDPVE